jgi:hypothetical protein
MSTRKYRDCPRCGAILVIPGTSVKGVRLKDRIRAIFDVHVGSVECERRRHRILEMDPDFFDYQAVK